VAVEVSQGGAHLAAALYRPGELKRGRLRRAEFIVDASTVLARRL
jgi:hypothetical protein